MAPRQIVTGSFLLLLGCGGSVADPPTLPTPQGGSDVVGVAPPSDRASNDDPAWSCLDLPKTRGLPPTEVTVDLAVRDMRALPVADVPVRACQAADDPACGGGRVGRTSEQGRVHMQVPAGSQGFAGYFEVAKPGDIVNLVFAAPPIERDVGDYPRSYFGAADVLRMAELGAVKPKNGFGTVMLGTNDCRKDGSPGVGVEISLEPSPAGAILTYLKQDAGGVVVSYGARATDATGRASIFNIPGGRYVIVGKIGTGRVVARTTIHVRPDTVSTLTLGPAI